VKILINNKKTLTNRCANPSVRHKMGWGKFFNPISLFNPSRSATFRRVVDGWETHFDIHTFNHQSSCFHSF